VPKRRDARGEKFAAQFFPELAEESLSPRAPSIAPIFSVFSLRSAAFLRYRTMSATARLSSKMQQVKRKKFFTGVLRFCNNRPVVSVRGGAIRVSYRRPFHGQREGGNRQ
jgi:hypothetical protein